MKENDWRLRGQEKFLKGVTLVRRRYRQYAQNPRWDHDHCSFCWAEFCLKGCPDALQDGYANPALARSPDPKVGGSNPLRHATFSPHMASEIIGLGLN